MRILCLAILVVGVPLPVLAVSGMEHVVQTLLLFVFLAFYIPVLLDTRAAPKHVGLAATSHCGAGDDPIRKSRDNRHCWIPPDPSAEVFYCVLLALAALIPFQPMAGSPWHTAGMQFRTRF